MAVDCLLVLDQDMPSLRLLMSVLHSVNKPNTESLLSLRSKNRLSLRRKDLLVIESDTSNIEPGSRCETRNPHRNTSSNNVDLDCEKKRAAIYELCCKPEVLSVRSTCWPASLEDITVCLLRAINCQFTFITRVIPN